MVFTLPKNYVSRTQESPALTMPMSSLKAGLCPQPLPQIL